MLRTALASVCLLALFPGSLLAQQNNSEPIPLAQLATRAEGDWERLADGSIGSITEFRGVGDVTIPAYLRKPKGRGPFPVVVLLHGGQYGKESTYAMGRSTPPSGDFAQAGWAVFAIDYRPEERPSPPIVLEDSIAAVQAVRQLPFIDSSRVGLMGGSRGGGVTSRLLSRIDSKGAILCAPAGLDLIEIKKAAGRGEPVVGVLKQMVANMEKQRGATAEEIEKDPAKFGYSSPLTEVGQARCPVLIINGRNDPASPVSVIDVYVQKMRAAGKEVDAYLPDNGPHGFYFGHPDILETKEAALRAVAFFQRCFQGP
jgi:dipeptidyl aminopeptidase/acylaminoacyl peptidase